MKKTLALFLACLMLLSLLAACSNKPATTPDSTSDTPTTTPADTPADEPADTPADEPAEGDSDEPAETPTEPGITEGGNASEFTSFNYDYFPVAETETLTFWKVYENVNNNNDINHPTILQWMEDKTNVHVDFETCSNADGATKFNLMLTSGDLCDVINNFTGLYTSTSTHAVEEGLIYDMTEKIPEWMPNYNALLASSEQATREAKTDEGLMPVIWTLGSQLGTLASEPIWFGLTYRQDWADEQGITRLETIEDWHTYLAACKANYPTCDSALSLSSSVWDLVGSFLTAYDTYPGFYVRDGVVGYGPLDEGYKQAVQNLNNWWNEGLIDPDFMANVFMGNQDKLKSDQVAAMGMIWGLSGTQMLDTAQVSSPNWNLTPAVSPVLNEGDTPKTAYTLRCIIKESTALDAESENIELAARWLDQWFCHETMIRQFLGVEGETFTLDDAGYHYVEGVGVYNTSTINLNDYGLVTASWGLYDFYNFDLSNLAANYHDSVHVWDVASTEEVMPSGLTLNAEEAEEYSSAYNDITTFVNENLAKFIMGMKPMSEYDDFVKTLTEGYDTLRCIELQQAAYNRYMAR